MAPIAPYSLSLTHIVRAPRTPAPEGTKPPLLILLHGVGSNEQDLMELASYLNPRFLIVSVRSPMTLGPGAYGWYPVMFTPQGPVGDTKQAVAGRDKIIGFVREAQEAYGADPKRVFLLGFSQGAIMSLLAGLKRPDLVAGIVPMSGRLLPEALADRADDDALRGLAIFAVHGTRDNVLPVSGGRAARDELSKLPVTVEYREYDMGHQVSAESLADVAAWLTAQLDATRG
jgi:phospholipase/carboxylesterase